MRLTVVVNLLACALVCTDIAIARLLLDTRSDHTVHREPFSDDGQAGLRQMFPFSEEGQLGADKFEEPMPHNANEASAGMGPTHVTSKVPEDFASQTQGANNWSKTVSSAEAKNEPGDSTMFSSSVAPVPRSVASRVDENNQTISVFNACSDACDQCFLDHFQGCLATCEIGCEDYCALRLPASECSGKQRWVANVGHVFQALNATLRMCRATGFDGCPQSPKAAVYPNHNFDDPPPFDPYAAISHDEDGGTGHKAIDPLDKRDWNRLARGPDTAGKHLTVLSSVPRPRK